MDNGPTTLRDEGDQTTLYCRGDFEASWNRFDHNGQSREAVRLAYERGRRDQAAETAKTLRNIFGLKG